MKFQYHYSSVTWYFRNNYNMLIWCSGNISYYYQCWKKLCCLIFLLKPWYIYFSVFTWNKCFTCLRVTFNQLNAHLLNKSIQNLSNGTASRTSVFKVLNIYIYIYCINMIWCVFCLVGNWDCILYSSIREQYYLFCTPLTESWKPNRTSWIWLIDVLSKSRSSLSFEMVIAMTRRSGHRIKSRKMQMICLMWSTDNFSSSWP